MSQNQINAMIPQALKEVKKFLEEDGISIESKYFSAIASFGVSVLQSGVHATYLFYTSKSDKKEQIPNMIIKIIKETKGITKEFINHDKEHILDATTALKLAIRTYKKVDNKEAQDE